MRKARAKSRIIDPDPRYGDKVVTKFVNNLMLNGKKNISFRIFYDAMDIIDKRNEEGGLAVFHKALENVTPQVEVKSRRVGGATFQIPQPIRDDRKTIIGNEMVDFILKKRETGNQMATKTCR